MQGSGYYQRDKPRWRTLYWTVREIIQRTLAIIPWHSFAESNSEGPNYFFSRSCPLFFFLTFPTRTNICIEYSSTSVTSKFRDWVRKWHHNPDDRTDIIFRLILSVLHFSLISSAMALIFCCPVSRPDDLFSLLKFGFVGAHQYSSLTNSNITHYSWTNCEN